MRFIMPSPSWGSLLCGLFAASGLPAHAQPDSLSLSAALARAQVHPSLVGRVFETQAREAVVSQSGAFENPRLALEAENVAGSGPYSGTNALETTLRLEQSVPLAGKRKMRRRQAEVEVRFSQIERAASLLEREHHVRTAFFEALAAQEKEVNIRRHVAVMDETVRNVERRRAAGGGQPGDFLRVTGERLRVGRDLNRAILESGKARARLAVLTGDTTDIPAVQGRFTSLAPLPEWRVVRQALLKHPELLHISAESEARRIAAELARAERIPDLTVAVGVRRIGQQDGSDAALVGGVSLPLPLWNRNTGAVEGADLRRSALAHQERAVRLARESEARVLLETLAQRIAEIEQLRTQLVPEARKISALAREAFQSGHSSALDLLDGQRLSYEVTADYLEALAAYHRDIAELVFVAGLTTFDGESQP